MGDQFCKKTLAKHDVRIFESSILFPIYDLNKNIRDITLLNMYNEEQSSVNRNSLVITKHFIDSLENNEDKIYITDSLLNLLAINERMTSSVIVIKSVNDLTQQLLAKLESYSEIIFWQKNKQLSFDLAKILNVNRCTIISHSRSSYEAHLLNESFETALDQNKFSLKEKSIIKFEDFKVTVKDELTNAELYSGTQWTRFPQLNQILKGHRRGELTIFTGPTGSGKTTFLGELTLDLASQGVKTLWGSFEIKNSRLGKMLMTQFAKLNLKKNIHLFDYISRQFDQLPFFFMDFHGEHSLENVLQTMSKAVIIHDVRHIIIDNLQFMVGTQTDQNNKFDKYALQDHVISSFRRFATDFDCHITIVIHPRKEESDLLLKMSSIFGTAKATQEADNIIILQSQKLEKNDTIKAKFIEVVKNRYDGELGKFLLKFDKESLCYQSSDIDESSMANDRNKLVKIDNEMFEDIKTNLSASGKYGPYNSKPR